MAKRRFLGILLALVTGILLPRVALSTDLCAGDDIVAIEFLGTVDCYWYPESQSVLINSLKYDPREKVRYASVLAITQQLQRNKGPLDPTYGWRKMPDPLIFKQICRIARLKCPLDPDELADAYRARQQTHLRKKQQQRGDVCHDCCNKDVLEALARTAFEKDIFGCWLEPSERIRWRAERALALCCGDTALHGYRQQYDQYNQDPTTGLPPMITQQMPQSNADELAPSLGTGALNPGLQGSFAGNVPLLGRADFSNRFNIFDNMNASPRTRAWVGFQYIQSQNNAVFETSDTAKLFSVLNTASGRADFISLTGFGRQPNRPAIDPFDPRSKQVLEDQFLKANGGRDTRFLQTPNSNLYRFGVEWALTTDFSVSVMGQYVQPLDNNGQPDSFSNPSIQLKHVMYRDEKSVFSTILGIQPQIPRPGFSIGEDTTRLAPGFLAYRQLSERTFTQGALGVSVPTESNQIMTLDYALGVGWWAYKDESLEPYFRGPPPEKLLLGFIPQFEVLGKSVLGSNTIVGSFDLNAGQPKTALGTVSPVDGSRNIYFPQDFTLFKQSSFIYRESRDNVDLTLGGTAIMRDNFILSGAVSVPVTGGNARALEFITSLNKYF